MLTLTPSVADESAKQVILPAPVRSHHPSLVVSLVGLDLGLGLRP